VVEDMVCEISNYKSSPRDYGGAHISTQNVSVPIEKDTSIFNAPNLKSKPRASAEVKDIAADIQIAGLDRKALVNLAKKYAAQGIIADIGAFVDIAYKYNKAKAERISAGNIFKPSGGKNAELARNTDEYRSFSLADEKLENAICNKKTACNAAKSAQGGELSAVNEQIKTADMHLSDAESNFFMVRDKYNEVLNSDKLFGAGNNTNNSGMRVPVFDENKQRESLYKDNPFSHYNGSDFVA